MSSSSFPTTPPPAASLAHAFSSIAQATLLAPVSLFPAPPSSLSSCSFLFVMRFLLLLRQL